MLSSSDNVAAVTAVNESMIPLVCGANFLPSQDAGEALQTQPQAKIQTIAGEKALLSEPTVYVDDVKLESRQYNTDLNRYILMKCKYVSDAIMQSELYYNPFHILILWNGIRRVERGSKMRLLVPAPKAP